eukprot:GDKI01045126.1.p1 GENE.GDKI01045126.1~~GDKI01045126.1.p1  ORF type:complete len:402 (-),score=146.22 GDKI01045126.1:129-1262(-)
MVLNSKQLYYASFATLALFSIFSNVYAPPILLQMLSYTGAIIYIGAHGSLKLFETDPTTGEKKNGETMTHHDAMLFPVVGSVALFSLYLAYKFLSAYWVNLLLTTYLSVLGVAAIGETAYPMIAPLFPESMKSHMHHIKFDLPKLPGNIVELGDVDIKFNKVNVVGIVVGLAVAGGWLVTKHWTLHNLFAIAFSMQAIAMISIGNFRIATILLCGLFIYDIFWVFGTEVMVTVAKSFEGPAKLIFPATLDPWRQSILGLGDIVIPGIFIAMCLRFDHHQHHQKAAATKDQKTTSIDIHAAFPKPYFFWVMVAYLLGLLTTGVVMFWFKAAQPALLYLVPFCLGALYLTAFFRGELKAVWEYTEEGEGEKKEGEIKKE